MTEDEVAAALARGDETVVAQLYERWAGRGLCYARGRLRNASDAD